MDQRLDPHHQTLSGTDYFCGGQPAIAPALMEGDMFSALSWILGFYSNFAIAWVVVVATDITFNKGLLKLAPAQPVSSRHDLQR